MSSEITNVTLVGVGGQGIILTSEILARTAAFAGLDVKKTEIHGMSQRGGSVSSQVRFGDKVTSPIIPDGDTDILIAFDELEAVRAYSLVRPSGRVIADRCYLVPVTVSSGMQPPTEEPPAQTLERIFAGRLLQISSHELATQVGNQRTANMVVAGALSTLLPFDVAMWHEALRSRLPPKLLDINIKAFDIGRSSVQA